MNNVLLDTNILLYAIDEESKYYKSVHRLLNTDTINFFTTSKNISEFLSVITRIPNSSISVEKALFILNDFQNSLRILYPTEELSKTILLPSPRFTSFLTLNVKIPLLFFHIKCLLSVLFFKLCINILPSAAIIS
ncbi:MAG: hypothetical protein FD188_372 [Ignavibacteria bacterium]|nr:MAG: hypothetical protein FD188_372 [Ignavibacteria bacterium]